MSSEISNHVLGFSTAGRIFFGWDAASVLRDVAREFGPRVFICTDRNMVKAGVCEKVVAHLAEGKAEIKIFDGGQPEVDRQTIENARRNLTLLMWFSAWEAAAILIYRKP
jgi:alcohol dehydrogenase class IV